MKISVAIATYNAEKQIIKQIESILLQTRIPDEIIISDDCSTDSTLQIIEELTANYKDLFVIMKNKKNLGFTYNFENAIKKCTGDIIFLSDQDDIWYENKIQVVENFFYENKKYLLLVHDGELVNYDLLSKGNSKFSQAESITGSYQSVFTGALTIFSKELKDIILPFPQKIVGHDRWIHSVAEILSARFVLNQKLQMIVRHESNTSEWIGSNVKKKNKLHYLLSILNNKPSRNYYDRIKFNNKHKQILKDILQNKIKLNIDLNKEEINNKITELKMENIALIKRYFASRNKNMIYQKILFIMMYKKGHYKYFNGIYSLLNDLIRR